MRSELRRPLFTSERSLRFEFLENRILLAGNVTAACNKGCLTICGDKCDNSICVRQIDECKWEIKGLCGTTVNGSDCCIVKDVKCISIDCKAGCDSVKVSEGHLQGCVKICDTCGDNHIVCSNICAAGISIATGSGKDCCYVTCCDIKSDSNCSSPCSSNGVKWNSCCINTGGGCDEMVVSDVSGSCCTIDVKSGSGADHCCIKDCEVKTICCDSGSGCDKVAVTGCQADRCNITCDKSDNVACSDNNFGKQNWSRPSQRGVDQCLREICGSCDWKATCDFGGVATPV